MSPETVEHLITKWRWQADRETERRDDTVAAVLRTCAIDLERACGD